MLARLKAWYDSSPAPVLKLLKGLAAIVILFLVAWFVDLGDALAQLQRTHWLWLLPALLIIQIQIVLSALRWRLTANALGQNLTTSRAIGEYYLATFANLSLPGGVTGDAARVYRNRQQGALSLSVHSVVIERLAGQLALLVVCVAGWLLWPVFMHADLPLISTYILLAPLLILIAVATVFFLLVKLAPDWITRTVLDFGPSIHAAWLSDKQWIVQSALSLAIVLTYVAVFYLCAVAVQTPLPVVAALTIVPMVLLSMLVPLSIGGWGIREAAAAVLWPVVGLSSEAGIATSVIYALVSLAGCLPGLLWHLYKSIKPAR